MTGYSMTTLLPDEASWMLLKMLENSYPFWLVFTNLSAMTGRYYALSPLLAGQLTLLTTAFH